MAEHRVGLPKPKRQSLQLCRLGVVSHLSDRFFHTVTYRFPQVYRQLIKLGVAVREELV